MKKKNNNIGKNVEEGMKKGRNRKIYKKDRNWKIKGGNEKGKLNDQSNVHFSELFTALDDWIGMRKKEQREKLMKNLKKKKKTCL